MKIYTKSGDEGSTGLFAGPRVSKDDPRIEAYGTVDELNAAIGVARSQLIDDSPPSQGLDKLLQSVQNQLFAVGAELATPKPEEHGTHWIGDGEISELESAIDLHEATLSPLTTFILPAGCPAAAALHLARGICRRAERRVVTLGDTATISSDLIIYLNRLGDLLFVLCRAANAAAGVEDTPWQKPDSP
jgi:cob(I)alamin adenosyltransferase